MFKPPLEIFATVLLARALSNPTAFSGQAGLRMPETAEPTEGLVKSFLISLWVALFLFCFLAGFFLSRPSSLRKSLLSLSFLLLFCLFFLLTDPADEIDSIELSLSP